MKIAIIGATGFVGENLVKEAVSRGLDVTAMARNIDKLNIDNVKKISVDVYDKEALAEKLKGFDVVLSAFNSGWTNPNIYDDFMKGSRNIQDAVKIAGVKRLIVVGGAGSLYVDENTQLIDTDEFPEEFKLGASGARDYLNELKSEKDLDWVFFSPAIEMNPTIKTGRTGKYRLGKDQPVFNENNQSILSVEDLAVVLLDELENPKHHQERFTAAY